MVNAAYIKGYEERERKRSKERDKRESGVVVREVSYHVNYCKDK